MTLTQPLPQNMRALAYANEIRFEGARIRRVLQALPHEESRRAAAELLRDPPEAIAHMRTGHFLSGIKRFGQARAIEFIRKAGFSAGMWDRQVGPIPPNPHNNHHRCLTARQREALAAVLTEGLS